MRSIKFSVLALALFILPSLSKAQCPPQYSEYLSYSITGSGNGGQPPFTVVQTVHWTGYTTCNMGTYVTHTPYGNNILNGQGGSYTGTGVCTNCQMSQWFSNTFYNMQDVPVSGDVSGGIQCSVMGANYFKSPFQLSFVPYTTFSKVDNWDGAWTWTVEPWCFNPPPLVNVGKVYWVGHTPPASTINYWQSDGFCVSTPVFSPGWHCTPGLDFPLTGLYIHSYCTPWSPPPY